MVKGIILAAGRGSRMGINTTSKPKCLNRLHGKTLLDWQLINLKKSFVKSIVVVTGYRSNMIKGDFDTIKNNNWADTNMVSSLFCLKNQNTDCIISYSDIVYRSEHVDKLFKTKGDIVITADINWKKLWDLRFKNPLDDAETFKTKNGILTEIGKKTKNINNIEAQYMGLLKLTKKGWDKMYEIYDSFDKQKQNSIDMTAMLNELLSNKISIAVTYVNGGWCEADTYSDILKYENEININKNWMHSWL